MSYPREKAFDIADARGGYYTLAVASNPANRDDLPEPGSDKLEWRLYRGRFIEGEPLTSGKATTTQKAKAQARAFLETRR